MTQRLEYFPPMATDYHFVGFSRFDEDKKIADFEWQCDVGRVYQQLRPVAREKAVGLGADPVCECSKDIEGLTCMISKTEIGFGMTPLPPKSSGNNSLRNRCLLVNRLAFREMAKLAGNGQEAVYDKLISLGILV